MLKFVFDGTLAATPAANPAANCEKFKKIFKSQSCFLTLSTHIR